MTTVHACMFVECMKRCRVGFIWTNSLCVRIGVCLFLRLVLILNTVVWGRNKLHSYAPSQQYTEINITDGCVFMFVQCMKQQRCRFGPGRTDSAFIIGVFLKLLFGSLKYEVVIPDDVLFKCTTTSMTVVRCLCLLNVWNGFVLSLDKQDVRLYCCVFEF